MKHLARTICTGPDLWRKKLWRICCLVPFALVYIYCLRPLVSNFQLMRIHFLINLPDSTPPKQIGLGRLTTDQSSFAYFTDVFIVPQYRGRGLGKWLMECVNETLESWPDLRCAILYAGGEQAQKFYSDTLGMKRFVPGVHGLEIMSKRGPGDVFDDA